jgi:predicted acylesterase/phospholipase RssA
VGIIMVLYKWLFERLPRIFSVFFILFAAAYYILAFSWLAYHLGPWVATKLVRGSNIAQVLSWISPVQVLSAFFTIGFALLGFVLAYGLAAYVYGFLRPKPSRSYPRIEVASGPHSPVSSGLLDRYHRVGIILAGGGAKGAYQAGALKAIHEFLSGQEALNKVKMIAGTSIGSWNALFWLADAMQPGCPCSIEQWWAGVDVPSIIRPWPYVPSRQNFFLSTDPWKEVFDSIFGEDTEAGERLMRHINAPDDDRSVHFYFTRSNVAKARLEFTTNHHGVGKVPANMPAARPRPPVQAGTFDLASNIADVKFAVFSSMDLPPLFRYTERQNQHFEDGGVVDNLPIRFGTEIENCDLLFILPLNATFAQAVNQKSIVHRMYRVMDVRQGVLERNAFKLIYLYNELAALRTALAESDETLVRMEARVKSLGVSLGNLEDYSESLNRAKTRLDRAKQHENPEVTDPTGRAIMRKNQPLQVFSVCPAPELAINTAEFWKTKEAGEVFQLMYEATTQELARFDFHNPPSEVQMAMVSPFGEISYFMDF